MSVRFHCFLGDWSAALVQTPRGSIGGRVADSFRNAPTTRSFEMRVSRKLCVLRCNTRTSIRVHARTPPPHPFHHSILLLLCVLELRLPHSRPPCSHDIMIVVRPRITISLLHPRAGVSTIYCHFTGNRTLGSLPRTRRVALLSTLNVLSRRRPFASAGCARRAAICRPRFGPGSGERGLRTGVRGGGPRGGAPEAVPLAVLEGERVRGEQSSLPGVSCVFGAGGSVSTHVLHTCLALTPAC